MSQLINCLILLGGIPLGFAVAGYILLKVEEFNRVRQANKVLSALR